jgi:copper chaperone NosL
MKLAPISRLAIALASLAIVATYFVPVWQILLWAPQYPEGLTMKIWLSKLTGEVEIINGLNHYIGMKHIKEEMFPEFKILPYIVGIFIAFGLATAITASRRMLVGFIAFAVVFLTLAMIDFYRWGYDYGHNLDPTAPIQVPGMSYQPPLIGYGTLLNFTAYSGPDTGGWIVIGAGVLAFAVLIYELYYRNRKLQPVTGRKSRGGRVVTPLLLMLGLFACSTGPEPIRYGQDECAQCKMTLTDKRFGAEIVTSKGKVFKFDDLNCLVNFLDKGTVPGEQVAQTLAIDFARPQTFVAVEKAFFLSNEAIKSPMRGDIATFSTAADRDAASREIGGGQPMDWPEVRQHFK